MLGACHASVDLRIRDVIDGSGRGRNQGNAQDAKGDGASGTMVGIDRNIPTSAVSNISETTRGLVISTKSLQDRAGEESSPMEIQSECKRRDASASLPAMIGQCRLSADAHQFGRNRQRSTPCRGASDIDVTQDRVRTHPALKEALAPTRQTGSGAPSP